MASVNKVILIGHAGRDAESKTFPNGDMVANVSIATTEAWKDKQTGEKKEATEWHRLTFGGGLAKVAAQYIKKGTSIYVEGSLKTRKWTDQSGQEKSIVEVRVDNLKLLSGRPDGQQQQQGGGAPAQQPRQQQAPQQRQQAPQGGGFSDMDDDIPF